MHQKIIEIESRDTKKGERRKKNARNKEHVWRLNQ
jgi:hypothetical protein